MVAPIPKTICDELFESINHLIRKYEYFDVNSFDIKKLLVSADKLMKVDAIWGHLAKASIYSLTGEFEKMNYHIEVGNRLPTDNKEAVRASTTITLSNAHFYLQAQQYYNQVSMLSLLEPFQITCAGFNSIGINKLNELILKAKSMNLQFNDSDSLMAEKVSKILSDAHLADEDIAKYADVFGEVLRENKLIVATDAPTLIVGDKDNNWFPETIFVVFKVKSDAKTAAKLYKESVKRAISRIGAFPDALHFSIEAV